MAKNPAAVALGRRGGKANTPAQHAARAENGKKGGRPRNRFAHTITGADIEALVEALESAAFEILELGCTCADQEDHDGCHGAYAAKPYDMLAARIRRKAGVPRENVGESEGTTR
jgi:hypothetical protein